jgi:iron complex transport system permease protein
MFFLMGDLASIKNYELVVTSSIVLLLSALLAVFGRDLDALSLGEEKAHYLGMNVKGSRKIIFIISSLIVAGCVSASGIIGFVGLMAPHFVRKFGIVKHRLLIPLSGITGAIILIISDAVARTAAKPVEMPVGVITGIFGAVFFIILYFRGKEWKMF